MTLSCVFHTGHANRQYRRKANSYSGKSGAGSLYYHYKHNWQSATPNSVLHITVSATTEAIRKAAFSATPISEGPSNHINYLYLSRNLFKIALNHYIMYFLETLHYFYVFPNTAHVPFRLSLFARKDRPVLEGIGLTKSQ